MDENSSITPFYSVLDSRHMFEKNYSNVPKFICIGAQKAGTTWLADILDLHPNFWNPGIKEIHFFDQVSPESNSLDSKFAKNLLKRLRKKSHQGYKEIPVQLAARNEYTFTLEDYFSLFSNCPSGRISWEITPAYASMTEAQVHYMTQLLPESKYLFIIRSPYERAVSQWRMLISRKFEHIAFDETKMNKKFDHWISKNSLNRGKYSSIIKTYAKHVDLQKQFLFLPFGELKTNPQSFLGKVYKYLNVTEYYPTVANSPSHITQKHKISEYISDRLRVLTAEESIFLENFFGEKFAKDCL